MRTSELCLLAALVLTSVPHASGSEPTPPASPDPDASSAAPPSTSGPSYDALFSEILQTLPERSRAKVDSARARAGEAAPRKEAAEIPSREAVEGRSASKRGDALQKLPPEVKERVEKAIKTSENRQTDRMLEFKELEK